VNTGKVRRSVFLRWRSDRDDDEARPVDRGFQILNERRGAALQMPGQRFGDSGFSVRRDAALQLMHALRHDVVADDPVSELGESDDASHPDITGTDNGDFRWF
jgi:hypothetical protein